jgi:bifunctional non-homologous end joining protein LigD
MCGSKEELLSAAQEFGLEGLVAKRKSSVYESGRRSGAWVKFKITKAQEFVIGGYTLPEGSRSHFGSLLVGYNSPDGSCSPAESAPVFRTRSWRTSTTSSRN